MLKKYSTHCWRDIIIVLMKKSSLAEKHIDAMRIEHWTTVYVYLQVVGTINSVHNNVERV